MNSRRDLTSPETASPASEPPAWRLRRHVSLRWRDWGGDSVVFDLRSGQTYQFAALTAAVLAYLEEGPCTDAALTQSIALDLDCPVDAELQQAVDTSLQRLQGVGWIEPTRAAAKATPAA